MAQPGDTVLVHAGIYRERVKPPRGGTGEEARITYQAAPGEKVTITALDPWAPRWSRSGNLHYAMPDESMFTDSAYVDGGNPYKIYHGAVDGWCIGQVVVDGQDYAEQTTQAGAEAAPGRWWAEAKLDPTGRTDDYMKTGTIYIHFPNEDPAGHKVEIATRRGVFRPYLLGLGYITVEGFTMEYCANQTMDGFYNPDGHPRHQSGLIGTRSGHHWTIRNNVISKAKSSGLSIGMGGDFLDGTGYNSGSGPNYVDWGTHRYVDNETPAQAEPDPRTVGYSLIYNNVFDSCGQNGIVGLAHFGNVIYGNKFTNIPYLNNRGSAETAAIKVHTCYGLIVEKNLFESFPNGSWTVWLDAGPIGTRVSRNAIRGHHERDFCAIYDEITSARQFNMNIIDDNLFLDCNAGIGGGRADGAGIYHNLFYSCNFAFSMGSSRVDCGDTDACGCGAVLHRAYNNLLIDNDDNYGLAFRPSETDVDSDYNILIPAGNHFELNDGGTGNPNYCGGKDYNCADITARWEELGSPGGYWDAKETRWHLDPSNGPVGCVGDFAAWKAVMDNIDQHTVERTKDSFTLGTRTITIDLTDDPGIGGRQLAGVKVDFNGNAIGASPKAGPFQDLGSSEKSYTFWDDANMPALPSLPAAPSKFTVTAASSTENRLAWTNNASNATHMVVERRKEGGDWVTWGYVNTTQDTISDDRLDSASSYQYRIAARNAAGLSAFVSPG
jgi:hypothetical protein